MLKKNKFTSDIEETFLFIKGYAISKKMNNTLIALSLSTKLHEGQFRKDGNPYIVHPLEVCAYLINLGIDDDIICASALLHDVIEDCNLPRNGQELVDEYMLDSEILDIVKILSKNVPHDKVKYYDNIRKNPKALIIKLSDRANNCSTLCAFRPAKMKRYIKETKQLIYPLCKYGKEYYPYMSNAIVIIKYQIVSICETVESLFNISNNDIDFERYQKTFLFIKGYAKGKNMNNTLIALSLALKYHEGQLRKSGDPFIIHPLRVCSYLISLGIDDDATCAAALLHEILKKCNLKDKGREIVDKFNISEEVLELIYLVSKDPDITIEKYYDDLKVNYKALLIKLSNKANTCTTLTSCKEKEKLEYIDEIKNFIYPLCDYGKINYPNYAEQIDNMQYHISSISKLIQFFIDEKLNLDID